jgi:hypothetical protein
MNRPSRNILALSAAAWLASLAAAAAQTVQVEHIRVQLFYENSGQLSDDLTKKKDLALWNTIIGEGDSGGPATAFLASVVLKSKPSSLVKREVVVTIMDDKKKAKVMERRFGGLSFGKDGLLVKPVLVENRTCSPTNISVSTGTSTKSVALPFECGE